MKLNRCFDSELLATCCLFLLAACGGSGGGSSGGSGELKTTITGSVYAAPVAGAGVTVKDGTGKTLAGPVTTRADGTYSVEVPTAALAGDLLFETTGGTFTDEASGTPNVSAGLLSGCAAAATLGQGSAVHLTPASTIAAGLVTRHGKTLSEAGTLCQQAFGFVPDLATAPANAPVAESTAPGALAALRAAAFSRLTQELFPGAPEKQFALLSALATDLKDGALDGKDDGSAAVEVAAGTNLPTDVLYKYARALTEFLNSDRNATGMTPTVALTQTYRVQYLQGAKPAVQGRTEFDVRITRRSDGGAVPGLSLTLKPLMHMTTKNHASPLDLPIVDNGEGTYSCAVYYLMNSGPMMGYWELNVVIAGQTAETATFHPEVAMPPMGNTSRAVLKGQADIEASVMVPPKRRYFLFNDGVTGTPGNHTIQIFLAAYDSMMSWPALELGTVLHPPAPAAGWAVTDVTVEASTDGTTWVTGVNTGAHWSVSGLTGLADATADHIYVRLTVNGEQKTVDGAAPSGANAYADFAVTPGM